jgi:hypothetical protein
MRFRVFGIIFGVVVAAAAAVVYPVIRPELRKPDISEMRAFLISHMTDDQLRAVHQMAADEAVKRQRATDAYKETSRAELNADIASCDSKMADVAYKARHPEGCNRLPQFLFDDHPAFRNQSTDEVFEEMIIGTCEFAKSVYEARRRGCLPPYFGGG